VKLIQNLWIFKTYSVRRHPLVDVSEDLRPIGGCLLNASSIVDTSAFVVSLRLCSV
jgi:hypothetical protein